MCIVSLWQEQAYIEGAKWEAVAGNWTPIKWLWTQVAKGTDKATGMQIQCILSERR